MRLEKLIPIRFGAAPRELSGVYHPARSEIERPGCVVLCNPFGQEAVRCHRMFRILAERLSTDGLSVLRFDYFGTGDSSGADDEGDIACWIDDILQADAEAVRRSGSTRSFWFGLGDRKSVV
jgi:alpha/beta superfamily hydrolase